MWNGPPETEFEPADPCWEKVSTWILPTTTQHLLKLYEDGCVCKWIRVFRWGDYGNSERSTKQKWEAGSQYLVSALRILVNIGTGDGLLPAQHWTITLTNADSLSIGPLGIYYRKNNQSRKKMKEMHFEVASAKWKPSCSCPKELRNFCLLLLTLSISKPASQSDEAINPHALRAGSHDHQPGGHKK